MTVVRQPKRNLPGLRSRLSKAGFNRRLFDAYLLPDWWDETAAKDDSLLSGIEFEVARFLGASIQDVRDPSKPLSVQQQSAKLRAPKKTDKASLAPAMHVGQAVACAVVRSLAKTCPNYSPLPTAPVLRAHMLKGGEVGLERLTYQLWANGIPVISIKNLPSPKFRAMACWAESRPVVVIGKQDGSYPSTLINVAHEAGHVGSGHITAEDPVIVEGESMSPSGGDDEDFEREAWNYCHTLLHGFPSYLVPQDLASSPNEGKAICAAAAVASQTHGICPDLLIHYWAQGDVSRQGTRKYALMKLGRFEEAQESLRALTAQYLDIENASESDRNLLRSCLP